MKITKISVCRIDVPIKPATISHGRVMSVFDAIGAPIALRE